MRASLVPIFWLLMLPVCFLRAESGIRADYEDSPGIEASVLSPYEVTGGLSGYLPYRVSLKNPTSKDRTWSVQSSNKINAGNGAMQASMNIEIECPANSEVTRDILVPVPPVLSEAYNVHSRVNLHLHGDRSHSDYENSHATPEWPGVAISEHLANRNLSDLKSEAKKRSSSSYRDNFGFVTNVKALGEDWRGLSSVDVFMLSDNEWEKLGARQRRAVDEWIHLGGTLDIYSKDKAKSLAPYGFGPVAEGKVKLSAGLGRIRLFSYDGRDLDAKQVTGRIVASEVRNRCKELSSDFRRAWGVSDLLEIRPFRAAFWLGLLTIFAVLVGPINLFLLTGKDRRHRLFITTPIISLVASLILGAFILVVDGFGGKGHRFSVVELQPGEGGRSAYLTQQSIASTGLLTTSAFRDENPSLHVPVVLAPSRWSRLEGDRSDSGNFDVRPDGTHHGSWFRSRSRHGFVSQTVIPSRARFELAGDRDAPALVSGLGFTADKVFYIDDSGAIWQSEGPVSTGQRADLVKATEKEFSTWKKDEISPASSGLKKDLRTLGRTHGHFYTSTSEATGLELDLLASLRWRSSTSFVFGPVTVAGESEG